MLPGPVEIEKVVAAHRVYVVAKASGIDCSAAFEFNVAVGTARPYYGGKKVEVGSGTVVAQANICHAELANTIGKPVDVVIGGPCGLNEFSRSRSSQISVAGIFGGLFYCIGLDVGMVNIGLGKEIFEDADPASEGVDIFLGIGLALVVMKDKRTFVMVELTVETFWFASVALKED